MEKAEFYRDARHDLPGPLAGVRVLEATTSWAGPMAACLLADGGADVIKCELASGEMSRHMPVLMPGTDLSFLNQGVNRNKRSLSIDLRRPAGRDLFLSLAARSDIIVENFTPGTLAGWGLGYDDCRKVKPDIVYVSVSGWGQFGPESSRAGYDPTAQAASGWMALNGPRDGAPCKAPTYIGDDLAGLHGALGAMMALHHRDRTGEGQHVDSALLDAVLFQSNGYLTLAAMGEPTPRMGSEVTVTCPVNIFECREGFIYLAVALDSHWCALCEVMGRPDLATAAGFATNTERVLNREAVNEAVAAWCRTLPAEEADRRIGAAGVAVAVVETFEDAARNPHVLERAMLQDATLEDGSVARLTGPAAKFSRTPTRVRHAAHALGEDTDDILREVGLDDDAIGKLRADGLV
ncbi:MAG: CoA transferase [Acidimicrobiia bacterium]|nr:CoA transferase [Acidimicrobiia bacterium]